MPTAFERIADTFPPTYYCEDHPGTEALDCAMCYGEKVARLDAHQAKFAGEPKAESDPDADYQKLKDHPDLCW